MERCPPVPTSLPVSAVSMVSPGGGGGGNLLRSRDRDRAALPGPAPISCLLQPSGVAPPNLCHAPR